MSLLIQRPFLQYFDGFGKCPLYIDKNNNEGLIAYFKQETFAIYSFIYIFRSYREKLNSNIIPYSHESFCH